VGVGLGLGWIGVDVWNAAVYRTMHCVLRGWWVSGVGGRRLREMLHRIYNPDCIPDLRSRIPDLRSRTGRDLGGELELVLQAGGHQASHLGRHHLAAEVDLF